MASGGFVRHEADGVPFYVCSALQEVPGLRHGFSTRHGGISSLPKDALNLSCVSRDTPENVEENRRRFLAALNLPQVPMATLSQTHSDQLHIIRENFTQWNKPEGDALATQQRGIALAVQVADCLPILIADPETGAIGAVHAGWRGVLARIFSKTVFGMQAAFGCAPARLKVAIGPGIRACCCEVGPEVMALFEKEYPGIGLSKPHPDRPEKFLLDLRRALAIQVTESGLATENIFDLGACTRCTPDEFFSYRREGARSGRMMAVISRL